MRKLAALAAPVLLIALVACGSTANESTVTSEQATEAMYAGFGGKAAFDKVCARDKTVTHWTCFFDGLNVNGSTIEVVLKTDDGWSEADQDKLGQEAATHVLRYVTGEYPQIDYVYANVNGLDKPQVSKADDPLARTNTPTP